MPKDEKKRASGPSSGMQTEPEDNNSNRSERFRRTREDHTTETAEDYVELIEDLTVELGEARLVDVANRMGVSHATANKTLGRLLRDGLITKQPYRAIFLTEEGQELARRCRARHEIVVQCLLSLGVPVRQAEIDAEGIEHHISETTLTAMSKFIAASASRS